MQAMKDLRFQHAHLAHFFLAPGRVSLAALLIWLAPVWQARAADQAQPSVAAASAQALEQSAKVTVDGRISSALDSTYLSGGIQFKGQDGAAQGTAALNPANVEDRISARPGAGGAATDGKNGALPSASNNVSIGARFTRDGFQGMEVKRAEGSSRESGACSPGAPQSLNHCHTRTPHWAPGARHTAR